MSIETEVAPAAASLPSHWKRETAEDVQGRRLRPLRRVWAFVGPRLGDDPRTVMAKVSIWLHWLAAILALLLMAIPPTSIGLVERIGPLALAAILFTIPLHRIPWQRLHQRWFVVTSFLDVGLIALGVALSGAATSRYQLLFFLVVVFAAYFYPIPEATLVTAVTAAVLASPLLYAPHSPPLITPIIAGAAGVMVLVGGVTKQTALRYQQERDRRDELEAERAQMYEEEVQRRTSVQQKTRQLESILEMGNAFRLQLGLDALLQKIVSAICETGGFRASLVRLFDPDTGEALCKAAYGIEWDIVVLPTPPELIKSLMDPKYQVSRSYLVEVDEETLANPDKKPYLYVMPEERPRTGTWRAEHTLIVPLETREHGLIGIISIDEPVSGEIPSLETIRTLEIFANLAATAIDNARLLEEASQAQALRELDRLKSEFLATVSHDLRTPLTVIKGSVDLLESSADELPPVHTKLLSGIGRNTQRLIDMVEQLLEMIQIQDGRVILHRRTVDLRDIVNDTAEAMTVAAAARNQRICVKSVPAPALLTVDGSRVQQVLTNLIGNACKYGPENDDIEVAIHDAGDEMLVSVHDNGGGIPTEDQKRIFEKFYRSEGVSSRAQGTGLGLAICKSLIDLHRGRIWVESGPAGGTVFTFALPKQLGHV